MAVTLRYDWSNRENKTSGAESTLQLTDYKSAIALAITRTTTAAATDYFNVIKTVNSGEERYTGGRRVENLALQSNDFDTTWTNTGTVVLAKDQTGFTGLDNDAWSLTDDSSSDELVKTAPAIALNQTHTVSLYILKDNDETRFPEIFVNLIGGTAQTRGIHFNTSTGATTVRTSNGSGTEGVIDEGLWWRLWVSVTAISTNTIAQISIRPSGGTVFGTHSNAATGTIIATRFQHEQVSGQDDPAPSEYVATTTAAVSKWYATKRRTNLILQSNALNVTWSNTRSTDSQAVAGQTNPVDGSADVNSINEDGTSAQNHRIRQTSVGTNHIGKQITFSGYFKASNRDWVSLEVKDVGDTGRASYFNLSTGAEGTAHGSLADSGIIDVGNGWFRCWVSVVTGTSVNPLIYIAEADNDIVFDGLSQESLYVYGTQVEDVTGQSSAAPSTYIPTTTTVESSSFDTAINPTGLLVEEARTNVCVQSEDFDTTWTESSAASTFNQTIAPDGTLTADKLLDDSATGTGSPYFTQTLTLSVSTAYCFSVFAKADQLDWIRLAWANTPLSATQYYDLTDGVVGTPGANIDDSGIEDVGNGWYRCWMTVTTDSGDANGALRIFLAEADGDIIVDLDGTSSVFVWGAQIEAGAFPTSYIPTVASSVTRNKDDIVSSSASFFTNATGTFYAQYQFYDDFSTNWLLQVDAGDADDRYYMYRDTGKDLNFEVTSAAGDNGSVLPAMTAVADTSYRHVIGYQVDDVQGYLDGSTLGSHDTAFDPPTEPMTRIGVGSYPVASSNHFNGNIAEIFYSNVRETNTVLDEWSSGTNLPVHSLPPDGDAWKVCIPVVTVTGRTKPWTTDPTNGYIPIVNKT